MPGVFPFPGLRYDQQYELAAVVCPPYDVIAPAEQQALQARSPYNAVQGIQHAFAAGGPVYIADGHHRYETALTFRQEAEASLPGAARALAVLSWAGDPGLLALPTHRLLSHLDPELTLEELETRWSQHFHGEYYPVWDGAPAEQVDA